MDADSGRHGCLGSLSALQPSLHLGDVLLQQFNAVINHAHGGRRAVLDTANRLHKCGGAPAGTENALCRGNTGHCPPWRPARWGDTGVDRVRLFWQPLIGFRRPHVCLISYFISWLGEQDYIWINITEPCLVISLLLLSAEVTSLTGSSGKSLQDVSIIAACWLNKKGHLFNDLHTCCS